MLKALLVDLDGTLVESAMANAGAYAAALEEAGIVVDARLLGPEIDGRSWRDFLPPLMAARPELSPEAVARRKRVLYPAYFHLLELNTALVDLLRILQGRLMIGLVTTASAAAVAGISARFDFAGLFDVVVCGDHVTRAKPHPEGYRLAADRLGVTPEQCLVIEDSETGIAAARAFGGGLLHWSRENNRAGMFVS